MRTVTVFGGSDPGADSPLYADALHTSRVLAEGNCAVATGGYGGIMEAVSRGASEAGGTVYGVTSPIFQSRPNEWIGESISEEDLFTRTRKLIQLADGFLVYPGRSGTLSELTFLWALVRARQAPIRPVALIGDTWQGFIDHLVRDDFLEERLRVDMGLFSTGPEAAVWILEKLHAASQ